jgi:uncharacterized damage-inducible protein DinB
MSRLVLTPDVLNRLPHRSQQKTHHSPRSVCSSRAESATSANPLPRAMNRTLVLLACLTLASETATAQAPDAKTAMRNGFNEVSAWVTKAADLVPPDKYSYRPTQSVRTFGQLVAHIADAHNWYCGNATGKKVEWSDAIEKGNTDKATLAQKLKQSIDACNAIYTKGGDAGQLIGNVGHTNLHYGNIITYMRMMGLTPPSS